MKSDKCQKGDRRPWGNCGTYTSHLQTNGDTLERDMDGAGHALVQTIIGMRLSCPIRVRVGVRVMVRVRVRVRVTVTVRVSKFLSDDAG